MIDIGLDPSSQPKNFGVCVAKGDVIQTLFSGGIVNAYEVVTSYSPDRVKAIWIEHDPKKIPHRKVEKYNARKIFALGGDAMAPAHVGKAMAEIFKALGYTVHLCPPIKGKPGKRTPEKSFQRLTGFTGRNDEHARDAFFIIRSKWTEQG